MTSVSKEEFKHILVENIQIRSQTAQGIFRSSVLSKRRITPLLKGDALGGQARRNVQAVADALWGNRYFVPNSPPTLMDMFDWWFDMLQKGLFRVAESEDVHSVNARYRTWHNPYYANGPKPRHLKQWMSQFCEELALRAHGHFDPVERARLLAWIDYQLDQVGHPWKDGCGRMATVVVCWVSLCVTPGASPPRFSSREAHYRSIRDLHEHESYFMQCLAQQ